MISEHDKEQYRLARALQSEIDIKNEQIDVLLDSLCTNVMNTRDIGLTMEIIEELPRGYHRSEMRTHLITLMNDRK